MMTNIHSDIESRIREMIERAGYRIDELPTMEEVEEAEKKAELARIGKYIDSIFGREFSNIDWKTLELGDDLERCKNFSTDENIFLLLRGGTGTAKTAIAKMLMESYLKRLFWRGGSFDGAVSQVRYIRALEFFDTLKRENSEPGGAGDFIRFHENFSFFVIDEVAASYGTEFERIYFNQLIDDFYTRKNGKLRKMILISNAPDDRSLERYIGKPALSRIAHRGLIVNMRADDWRKNHRQEKTV